MNGIVVRIPSALYTSAFLNESNVSYNENTTWSIEFGANYSSPGVSCDVQLREQHTVLEERCGDSIPTNYST